MVYHGRVKDGNIVLDEPLPLPDGTRVLLEVTAQGENYIHFALTVVSTPEGLEEQPPEAGE